MLGQKTEEEWELWSIAGSGAWGLRGKSVLGLETVDNLPGQGVELKFQDPHREILIPQ